MMILLAKCSTEAMFVGKTDGWGVGGLEAYRYVCLACALNAIFNYIVMSRIYIQFHFRQSYIHMHSCTMYYNGVKKILCLYMSGYTIEYKGALKVN